MLVGISHSTCCARKYRYGHHQMNPPDHLSREQVSFLIQYFPLLYSLPGGFGPNSDLRSCAANFLWDYPANLANPMKCVHDFQEHNQNEPRPYQGDLEADYIMFLDKVQEASKENPLDVEFDFR